MTYPTQWKRTTMRGCGPAGSETCYLMDLPVENRMTAVDKLQVRHIWPKPMAIKVVEEKARRTVDTGREGNKWWATLMNGSRADNEMRRVYGNTEREALQNLGEKIGVDWHPCRDLRQP